MFWNRLLASTLFNVVWAASSTGTRETSNQSILVKWRRQKTQKGKWENTAVAWRRFILLWSGEVTLFSSTILHFPCCNHAINLRKLTRKSWDTVWAWCLGDRASLEQQCEQSTRCNKFVYWSFIDLFKSALYVSSDRLAHIQRLIQSIVPKTVYRVKKCSWGWASL